MFRCANETQSDYLEFSNYVSLDRKLARFCGTRSPVNEMIESERDFFRMVFHSNAMFDGTGFSALYQFTKQQGDQIIYEIIIIIVVIIVVVVVLIIAITSCQLIYVSVDFSEIFSEIST